MQLNKCFENIQTSMSSKLADEAIIIIEAQTFECKMLKDEILEQVKSVNEQIQDIRTKISEAHDESPDKSFLKSDLKMYLEALPRLDGTKLQELLETDEETCNNALKNAKENAEKVSHNYQKILKKMQDDLMTLSATNDRIMFGTQYKFEVVSSENGPTKRVFQ